MILELRCCIRSMHTPCAGTALELTMCPSICINTMHATRTVRYFVCCFLWQQVLLFAVLWMALQTTGKTQQTFTCYISAKGFSLRLWSTASLIYSNDCSSESQVLAHNSSIYDCIYISAFERYTYAEVHHGTDCSDKLSPTTPLDTLESRTCLNRLSSARIHLGMKNCWHCKSMPM